MSQPSSLWRSARTAEKARRFTSSLGPPEVCLGGEIRGCGVGDQHLSLLVQSGLHSTSFVLPGCFGSPVVGSSAAKNASHPEIPLVTCGLKDQIPLFVVLCQIHDNRPGGCVATFKKRQQSDGSGRAGAVSCNHPEQLVDELNLSPTIRTAHPPRLPLPDHVHGLVALDRSPRRVECTKALLRRHASFNRSMIRLHDVVHVLDRSVAATASQDSCLFHSRNCRAVETGLVSVDDAGLRMRRISQRLAEQACGRSGIAPPREHEVDRGAAGIDGSVEVAPMMGWTPPAGAASSCQW